MVRDGERLARVLLHQEDGGASFGYLAHRLEDAPRQNRRQPERWFVEHEHLGVGHHCPADGKHLLLASRQRPRQLHTPFGQPGKEVEHRGFPLLDELMLRADEVAAEREVLFHREDVEDSPALRDVADAHAHDDVSFDRSEEHTSELQSLAYLVCRLLLEKKKTTT